MAVGLACVRERVRKKTFRRNVAFVVTVLTGEETLPIQSLIVLETKMK